MQILALPALAPTAPPPACVAALGFFDGVHRAHAAVLHAAAEEALCASLPLLVFTFASADAPKGGTPRLSDDGERAALFYEAGASLCVLSGFSAIAGLSPEDFVARLLVGTLGATVAVVGEDFRFGHRALGDAVCLARLMEAAGGRAHIVPSIRSEGEPISSTRIRRALAEGDCEAATALLGRPYSLSLPVCRGAALGTTLGIPTANQCPAPSRMLPAPGVYRTSVTLPGGAIYDGVTDVGSRPTVDGRETRIETHLLDFSGDLYGQTLTVAFHSRLRGERRFPSLSALTLQIQKDIEEVRAWRMRNGHS